MWKGKHHVRYSRPFFAKLLIAAESLRAWKYLCVSIEWFIVYFFRHQRVCSCTLKVRISLRGVSLRRGSMFSSKNLNLLISWNTWTGFEQSRFHTAFFWLLTSSYVSFSSSRTGSCFRMYLQDLKESFVKSHNNCLSFETYVSMCFESMSTLASSKRDLIFSSLINKSWSV